VSESHLCLQNITCISKSEHNTLEKNWRSSGKNRQIFLKAVKRFAPSSHNGAALFMRSLSCFNA
jgi:hypothetical protein